MPKFKPKHPSYTWRVTTYYISDYQGVDDFQDNKYFDSEEEAKRYKVKQLKEDGVEEVSISRIVNSGKEMPKSSGHRRKLEAVLPRGSRKKNPLFGSDNEFEKSMELSRKFHGRDNRYVTNLIEEERYQKDLAELGTLVELGVLISEMKLVPINFETDRERDKVILASNPDANQLYIVGGDQSLDTEVLKERFGLEDDELDKRYICIGEVLKIAYHADKHHLEGPKREQAKGTDYEHEFGEEGGSLPYLFYDQMNFKIRLVGGSYKIEETGIRN